MGTSIPNTYILEKQKAILSLNGKTRQSLLKMLRHTGLILSEKSEELVQDCVVFDQVSIAHSEGFLLKEASFTLKKGDFCYLTGESGSGKTSLLRLIYMDLKPYSGSISLFGEKIRGLTPRQKMPLRQKLGIVFQNGQFLPHLSILENVALPLHIRGFDARKALKHAEDLLKWMGVLIKPNQSVLTLSGGEKKRLAVARAVIGRPQILLADEPTGDLDAQASFKIIQLLKRLNEDGITVLMSTHNRALMRYLPRTELHLQGGQLHVNTPAFSAETAPQNTKVSNVC
jgi:cell division transport system ATP-binding protein